MVKPRLRERGRRGRRLYARGPAHTTCPRFEAHRSCSLRHRTHARIARYVFSSTLRAERGVGSVGSDGALAGRADKGARRQVAPQLQRCAMATRTVEGDEQYPG